MQKRASNYTSIFPQVIWMNQKKKTGNEGEVLEESHVIFEGMNEEDNRLIHRHYMLGRRIQHWNWTSVGVPSKTSSSHLGFSNNKMCVGVGRELLSLWGTESEAREKQRLRRPGADGSSVSAMVSDPSLQASNGALVLAWAIAGPPLMHRNRGGHSQCELGAHTHTYSYLSIQHRTCFHKYFFSYNRANLKGVD